VLLRGSDNEIVAAVACGDAVLQGSGVGGEQSNGKEFDINCNIHSCISGLNGKNEGNGLTFRLG